ncbi:MAG: Stp1/IreP family PP2C-type Ser/Thr phosphatase [Candidatus Methanomethylophilaceae archaeon]|nr:Stp1/IreP family PP2C-type Ser/Thr phosphatase [Candidatus Methanomethylophilaceae archaeon]
MKIVGRTDLGKRRRKNEDCFAVKEYGGVSLVVVCDGMGGANGGTVASSVAVEQFTESVDAAFRRGAQLLTEGDCASLLAHAAAAANGAVYRKAAKDETLQGMGTTLVAALFTERTMYVANVGDSRLYLMSQGRLRQITRDHSLVQYMIDSGKLTPEEAKDYPNRNIITRAIGIERIVDVDILSVELFPPEDSLILLCSDGLSSYVSDETIETILQDGLRTEPFDGDSTVGALIDAANDAGGMDNVTAVLIRPEWDGSSEKAAANLQAQENHAPPLTDV